jgi:hypothetical protein
MGANAIRLTPAFEGVNSYGLESVSGLSQHALLVDVATKVLADNLAALLNRGLGLEDETPVHERGKGAARRQTNRAHAAKMFSRWIGPALLLATDMAQRIHEWVLTLMRCTTRYVPDRSQPRKPHHAKPHPSQSYKRAA